MAEVTQTLSCRLPATLAAAVDERRRISGKESVSEYLKCLIMADLDTSVPPVRPPVGDLADMESVTSEIHGVREDLATLAVALLVVLGKQAPDAAEDWVRSHLSPKHQ